MSGMSGAIATTTRREMRAMTAMLSQRRKLFSVCPVRTMDRGGRIFRPARSSRRKISRPSQIRRKLRCMMPHRPTIASALSTIALCLLAAPLRAQSNELTFPLNAGFVTTTATAHRRIPNTVVDVSVGIQTQGQDAASVSRDLAQLSQALLGWLRAQGAERLATEQVSFQPQTHEEKSGQQKIVGYSGSTTVSFRTTPAKIGEVLSGVLENGANTIQQTSYAPKEEDEEKVRKELAQEATKSAMEQAGAVAAAANTRVIGVREVNVQPNGFVRPMPMMRAEAMVAKAASPAMGTEAGDQDLSVNVSVRITVSR
jgi:uncharacterized protein YggE